MTEKVKILKPLVEKCAEKEEEGVRKLLKCQGQPDVLAALGSDDPGYIHRGVGKIEPFECEGDCESCLADCMIYTIREGKKCEDAVTTYLGCLEMRSLRDAEIKRLCP